MVPRAVRALTPPHTALKLGYLPITLMLHPLLVAHGLGYFDQEGLSVERPVMVRSWQILTESFLADKFTLTPYAVSHSGVHAFWAEYTGQGAGLGSYQRQRCYRR